ncbi:MAG: transcription-repair coupling factor [Lentimicrobium sp.]|nr:transcription-repair coupling factor [Lentimicrobium sp.]MDD2527632.1 transcription-repair coupling factor [Lentimicrobiaceae bacterium]MDD4597955.1 transcription-repair coupling factor [Lentimicrobiaceae bacterium]
MIPSELIDIYRKSKAVAAILHLYGQQERFRLQLRGLTGSALPVIAAAAFTPSGPLHLLVLPEKVQAAYFFNDLENLLGEQSTPFHKKRVLFFPTTYRRPYEIEKTDNTNILSRTEVMKRIGTREGGTLVVTYPEALAEKVVSKAYLKKNTLRMSQGENLSVDFVIDLLAEYNFERVDFVVEPGQYSLRGGIIDVFSFTNDRPYRIEFFGDDIESIRTFDPANQLSIDRLDHITITPNIQDRTLQEKRQSFLSYIPKTSVVWIRDFTMAIDIIAKEFEKAEKAFVELNQDIKHLHPDELFSTAEEFRLEVLSHHLIEFGSHFLKKEGTGFDFNMAPQPSFNKNFDLLLQNLDANTRSGIHNLILSDSAKQTERIQTIFSDLIANRGLKDSDLNYDIVHLALSEGFIDREHKLACYTDHQIFERYHKYRIRDGFAGKQAITMKEIYDLQPGDYVTHIDHGVGRFDGLEKIENNGRQQEAMRLIYQNNDILYVSIHSLHRISKYVGKEGTVPSLNKLGSQAWNKLKSKTKQRVKDIARDLIKLYAERKAAEGFAFTPDTYMQHELEASFIYEDTPDQVKSTADIKRDLEKSYPMDRLVCGDVGFGKTEIAIRAAFKAVADSKQVAVLVPTTILALQHYKTFSDRLADFPCKVDYINRFRSSKQQSEILKKLEKGDIDILIGTHRLVSKDIKFKDLGLMIIDEEQKFGVATKEKLKKMKVNVDTLTLTATPIPRTLQFSLMGARDLSVINTPPPNRYPVQTELHTFDEETIRDAINFELSRGGQVFFVHNRVNNILEVAGMIQRLVPDARVAIGHGQMDGQKLEKVMLDFVEGHSDVLVATTIIESGLDIPNVNTILINEAQNYGLSDLHQLRGRVGRTNKKAFCYLLTPPLSVLTDEARKRLKAIEEFSELGSGFNIAMRDLDIRGAGNILGAEQSGFISEIGFEMYQRILDEAIMELKESDFKGLYEEEAPATQKEYVKECLIETDLEIMLPDSYVTNITERLSLYKELDGLHSEEELLKFQENLIDRFGPVPRQTQELINTLRLRRMARHLGFEKISLKNNLMNATFITDKDSAFYQSGIFSAVLQFIQVYQKTVRMKEVNEKLSLTFKNVDSVSSAIQALLPLEEMAF